MNQDLSLLAFIAATVSIFGLPLVPALWEWRAKKDATPLRVVQDYNADIRHFAQKFREFIETHCRAEFQQHCMDETHYEGRLHNKNRFQVTGKSGIPLFDAEESRSRETTKLFLSCAPMTLPQKMAYDGEIYATNSVTVEPYCRLRALLCEDSVLLGTQSVVLRWIHSQTTLTAMPKCVLYGRASAEQRIVLGDGCRFERLHSGRIEFGRVSAAEYNSPTELREYFADHTAEIAPGFFLIEGNLELPEHSLFRGNLIVKGNLSVGANSRIDGNVKASGAISIGANCMIDGALVSELEITMFQRCRIKGPVVSEKTLVVRAGTVIGTENKPTTLSAPKIEIDQGVLAFGSVWAEEEGRVSGN